MISENYIKKYDSNNYEETGFLFPIDAVGADEINIIRKDFELAEAELSDPPTSTPKTALHVAL